MSSCNNWGRPSVAGTLLRFWLAAWRWTSAWTETSPLFTVSRNVSARWKPAQNKRGKPWANINSSANARADPGKKKKEGFFYTVGVSFTLPPLLILDPWPDPRPGIQAAFSPFDKPWRLSIKITGEKLPFHFPWNQFVVYTRFSGGSSKPLSGFWCLFPRKRRSQGKQHFFKKKGDPEWSLLCHNTHTAN